MIGQTIQSLGFDSSPRQLLLSSAFFPVHGRLARPSIIRSDLLDTYNGTLLDLNPFLFFLQSSPLLSRIRKESQSHEHHSYNTNTTPLYLA